MKNEGEIKRRIEAIAHEDSSIPVIENEPLAKAIVVDNVYRILDEVKEDFPFEVKKTVFGLTPETELISQGIEVTYSFKPKYPEPQQTLELRKWFLKWFLLPK
jgi:hypothetical protein